MELTSLSIKSRTDQCVALSELDNRVLRFKPGPSSPGWYAMRLQRIKFQSGLFKWIPRLFHCDLIPLGKLRVSLNPLTARKKETEAAAKKNLY
jgi:hypothetical protein